MVNSLSLVSQYSTCVVGLRFFFSIAVQHYYTKGTNNFANQKCLSIKVKSVHDCNVYWYTSSFEVAFLVITNNCFWSRCCRCIRFYVRFFDPSLGREYFLGITLHLCLRRVEKSRTNKRSPQTFFVTCQEDQLHRIPYLDPYSCAFGFPGGLSFSEHLNPA